MRHLHSLKIINKIKETHDCVSLTFEIPNNISNQFKFKSGQYLTLKLNINGKNYFRNYSICSTCNSDYISVAIRKVENGIVSNYINDNLNIGEVVDVSEPDGEFCYNENENEFIVAIAAGSGITPIISIIKTALITSNKKIVLFYSNKTKNDSIFFEEINRLKKEYEDRLQTNFYFSRENVNGHHSGRISNEFVQLIPFSLDLTNFYLCGPESLVEDIEDQLLNENINKDQIFKELFFIKNETATIGNSLSSETQIKVTLEDEVYNLSSGNNNEPLLNIFLANDLDVPYSCRGGICSTCVCTLTEGKVVMLNNHILSDDEILQGKILTCQAIPQTDNIEVNYDV